MVRTLRFGIIAIAIAAALVPIPPAWIESAYAQGAYLAAQREITSWSNAAPVAVTDLLLAAALIGVAVVALHGRRVRARKGAWAAAVWALGLVATTAAVAYLVFLLMWGLNYRREPLAARLDFDRARVTSASVGGLGRLLAVRLNELHDRVHAAPWPAWEALPGVLGPSFAAVQRQLASVAPAVAGVPKRSLLTFYFERAGVAGMTDPFALEVVVDRSQLPFERPFVAAHEWAHLAGYANEAEANFIGWLVCFQGPAAAEYSGGLALLVYVLGSLPPEERAQTIRALGSGPRQDLAEMARHAARAWPWLQRPAWWVYDRYLRANRVEQGMRSYGEALQLIAGTRFEKAWVPAMRGRDLQSAIRKPE
jgi:hypothetical protein